MTTKLLYRCMGDRRVEVFCKKCARLPRCEDDEEMKFRDPVVSKAHARGRAENLYRCALYRSMEEME